METDVDGATAGATVGIGAGAATGLAETTSVTATAVCWLTSSCKSVFSAELHKKWSFPLRISSVNVTKSAGSCGFSHIYWGNL